MVEVSSKAPDFSLPGTDTEQVSLDGLRAAHGNVVVAFFPAAFTGVCETELCTFRDSLTKLNEADAGVVAISVDGPFSNAAFAKKNELNFPVLSDVTRDAVRAWGIAHDDFAGMPGYTAAKRSVFVVDADGTVQYAWVAPNPGVEPDYDAVLAAAGA